MLEWIYFKPGGTEKRRPSPGDLLVPTTHINTIYTKQGSKEQRREGKGISPRGLKGDLTRGGEGGRLGD